ncbi:Bcr/CflA family efflux MFS transporter, partial [bacterium]|nr:Bcr/CflA family efflux MFS transporter [bacterium]
MNRVEQKPPLWIIVFISGLPLFSETVYSPSLPEITKYFACQENTAEHTLTIYLAAFALGMLLWGKLADRFGRRIGILSGFAVYLLGCWGCFIAPTISWFMAARFVQAFGACVGSVLGQTISRDSFTGKELVRAYAAVGSAHAVFPALGPIIGGYIAQQFFWKTIFLFLIGVALCVIAIVYTLLPETLHQEHRLNVSMPRLFKKMVQDKMVIGLGLLIAAVSGIRFSYFSEAPFYFMELLHLDAWWYTKSFIGISIAGVLAGMFCHRMHVRYSSYELMRMGIFIALSFVTTLLSFAISSFWILYSSFVYIIISLLCIMGGMFGLGIVTTVALPMALIDYRKVQGTASALFGFYYY